MDLVLKDAEGTLNDNILQNRAWRNVDGTVFSRNNNDRSLQDDTSAEVDITSDRQVIKLNDVGNAADTLLELSHLFEVAAKLDERSRAESVWIDDQLTVAECVEVRFD